MSKVIAEKLLAGFIFGDKENNEYIYLPGGEVGTANPLCVFECGAEREDLTLADAALRVEQLTLRPCAHPLHGRRSF